MRHDTSPWMDIQLTCEPKTEILRLYRIDLIFGFVLDALGTIFFQKEWILVRQIHLSLAEVEVIFISLEIYYFAYRDIKVENNST